MYRRLKFISIFCLFALVSNLSAGLVIRLFDDNSIVNVSVEEDEETDQKSSKRTVNLLEEELHLSPTSVNESLVLFSVAEDKTNFVSINRRIKEIKKAPLEIPPEQRS